MDTVLTEPQVLAHALETFGSEEKAARWMQLPLAELGGRTPGEAIAEGSAGVQEVEIVLGRIDYGIYA